ncbi:MAG TPA: hypothetical protein DEQ20_10880 [Desulfobulbaceae bacterium]|nr:MAG: hypothetical protein A2520_05540 [Deltaproteobacteria bacterium RIFOXYD12_FULL_53_23]HCC55407.1 hypothetical protein [Desulfobulbaceae bacterium]
MSVRLLLNRQVVRYGLVGVTALGMDIATFSLLRASGADLILANIAARLIGALATHAGHHFWTFRIGQLLANTWRSTGIRYAALWTLSTFLSTTALHLLGLQQGLFETAAKLGIEAGIVVLNFILCRTWVFR